MSPLEGSRSQVVSLERMRLPELQRRSVTRVHIAQMVHRRLSAIGAVGSPQSFRVSWITMFAAAGGHLETARDAAGHAALETTSGYLGPARGIPPEEMDRVIV